MALSNWLTNDHWSCCWNGCARLFSFLPELLQCCWLCAVQDILNVTPQGKSDWWLRQGNQLILCILSVSWEKCRHDRPGQRSSNVVLAHIIDITCPLPYSWWTAGTFPYYLYKLLGHTVSTFRKQKLLIPFSLRLLGLLFFPSNSVELLMLLQSTLKQLSHFSHRKIPLSVMYLRICIFSTHSGVCKVFKCLWSSESAGLADIVAFVTKGGSQISEHS